MFVVNQSGDMCEELNKATYEITWDEPTTKALDAIYNKRIVKEYNYGSRARCLAEIKAEQDHYLSFHRDSKVLVIYVNGTKYGTYTNIKLGRLMFEYIVKALKAGNAIVTLEPDNNEEVNNNDK